MIDLFRKAAITAVVFVLLCLYVLLVHEHAEELKEHGDRLGHAAMFVTEIGMIFIFTEVTKHLAYLRGDQFKRFSNALVKSAASFLGYFVTGSFAMASVTTARGWWVIFTVPAALVAVFCMIATTLLLQRATNVALESPPGH